MFFHKYVLNYCNCIIKVSVITWPDPSCACQLKIYVSLPWQFCLLQGPTSSPSADAVKTAAKEFLRFINRSPSPFHVVEECKARLMAAGFSEIKETEAWNVKPKDKCFVTRNQSAIVAFAVGGQYRPGNGFSIIGAHTDSPVLKVKPVSTQEKHGYVQVGVECYGGGMWHSWLDRDLKLAGRVFIRKGSMIESHLLHVDRPILRVPNICIHFQREMTSKFEFNKETHLLPVIATVLSQKQESTENHMQCEAASTEPPQDQCDKHSPALIQLLCNELAVEPTQILDFELLLSDAVPATLGGVYEEFVFAPRLDNLHSCFCAIEGLTRACSETDSLDSEPHVRMIALFDNEETGSQTAAGAGSKLLELILKRLCTGGSRTAFEESMPKSIMVSADMAHAVHPNYSEKHEGKHRPEFHKGVVIKINANQRYATTAATTVVIREVARKAEVPLQDFVVKNDSPCGSTIGPIMSANLGIPTIDLGAAQLSMHSIREMCETTSVYHTTALFKALFEEYPRIMASMKM
ncbi:hypothetical protein NP493_64g05043 [Ridgeia piscesae]|uniref:Aspartyl aminopeptidase n=1 Tax=Ridgeia piscesae TaxID=27915 RepID=A0AAD9UIN2_RIDPI|nr:hypothetical protein NP493_64g05043 [Ridgeia piscesae]